MIFNTSQVNIELPYHDRYNVDYDNLVSEIERINAAKKKQSAVPIALDNDHSNAKILKSYMESYMGLSLLQDDKSLSQSVPNNNNSTIIDLTKDMKDPSEIVKVVDQLLDNANVTHAVMVINVHLNSILFFYTAFSNVFFFYSDACNQCLVWDLLVKTAYEIAETLPPDTLFSVPAMSRILLSPMMETTISNHMKKKCDARGTLYIRPKDKDHLRLYKTTTLATPRIYLRAKDRKIMSRDDFQSLPMATWGSKVIKGVFEPEPNFTVIEESTEVNQEDRIGRGKCNQLYSK